MGRPSLKSIVEALRGAGHALVCDEPVDPDLELAEIQRRLYRSQAPAVLFTNVAGCRFPMLANLFGTIERARYVFRDTYESVRRAIELKIEPQAFFRQPTRYWKAPLTALAMQPRRVRSGPILHERIRLSELPQLRSWPLDGGPFITLPQVYTEDVNASGWRKSNLGMYRVQLSGNEYARDREMGLHYQIHRGIGVHHQAALRAGKPFRVNVFVGGHPAMTLAAVMPLPEGLPELTFAGALAGHRIPLVDGSAVDGNRDGRPSLYADADFCICGTVEPDRELPEGPFGDHLGYYSLQHPYPVLRVEQIFARKDAIWPFTVVGRPPQEDTTFGQLIHELTGPVIPTVLPGVKEVNAVDAAGVHPLLLAIGSERYVPYRSNDRPAELLTQANAILGHGQMSLAKYLFIVNAFDDPELDLHDIGRFFRHLLARVDWSRDLHFQTRTTIDTLDYTGDAINEGSKLVVAARGPVRRELATETPRDLRLPDGFNDPRLALPGVLVVQAPPAGDHRGEEYDPDLRRFCESSSFSAAGSTVALVTLVDDSRFAAETLNNWLWTTFTRSQPSQDVLGIGGFSERKHWGCLGPLIIDARLKPRQAPPLVEEAKISARVDARAAGGSMLSKWL
ncbi:MAG TPA: UbiD family decarboxylase [Pirellulaceae bacterium]|jgi:4-hydroxy-3-polyprenylbenzoate decarboxylase|nr:UbiD family decarboxylase [Pirellulaceae bacterium]